MGVRIDLAGQTFGRLTVIEYADARSGCTHWRCRCECGNEAIIAGKSLRRARARSCGCLNAELTAQRASTHRASKTPEYLIWANMKKRCFNQNRPNWKYYGGLGITICAEWREDFPKFLEHVGPRPGPEFSIDRVNPFGNYEPGNVRWATASQQQRNKRCNYDRNADA